MKKGIGRKKGIDKPCSSNAVEFGSPIESNISELAGFSLEDREKLIAILESMKSLETQVQRLNKKLDTNTKEIGKLKDENIKLKQALLLAVYDVDALEQYGRQENIRIHGVAEKLNSNEDDGEVVVANIAAELGITDWVKRKIHQVVSRDKLSHASFHIKSETNYCMQKKI